MKKLLLILCSIICIKVNAQLQTFYTPNKNSVILDFVEQNQKSYILIANAGDTVYSGDNTLISTGEGSNVLIELDENGKAKELATFKQTISSYVDFRVLSIEDELYVSIATDKPFEFGGKEYSIEGKFKNFFLFKIADEISQSLHYYNLNCEISPEILMEEESCHFFFFVTDPELNSTKNQKIEATNTAKKYYGYSLSCQLVDGNFKLVDDIAVDFKGNTDIAYRKYMFYRYSVGSGMLFGALCNGLKLYRDDQLLVETDSFDIRTDINYPVSNYLDKAVKPLIGQHDKGWLIYITAFYTRGDKSTFYLYPGSASTICFNGECITNPNPTEKILLIIKDYNWLTGEGELIKMPENHLYVVEQIVKTKGDIYALAMYGNEPGYWKESKLDLSGQSYKNLFVAKINEVDDLDKPFIIRGIDLPYSLTQWQYNNNFKASESGISVPGSFARGMKVANSKDSILAKTGSDKFYLKIPFTQLSAPRLSERNFGIYPNPNSSQNNWVQIEIPSQDIELLKVYNTKGQLLQSNPISQGSTNYHLNTSSLAKGLYIIKLTSNKGIQYHQKLIRQ